MLARRWFGRGLWAALLLPIAAAAAPAYPVTARLTPAPQDRQQCLAVPGEHPDCRVVEAVRAAFAASVARMFQSGEPAALELVLQLRTAEISAATGRLEIDLGARISVSAGGRLIDEIDSSSQAILLVAEPGPIAVATREAARQLALDFEQSYRESRKVADYLIGAKVAPVAAVETQERGDRVTTLNAGLGFLNGGDNSYGIMPSLQVSVATPWLFARVGYAHSAPSFTGLDNGSQGDGTLATNDFWVEAGGVYRFTPSAEVRLGPGLHYMVGSGSLGATSQNFNLFVPVLAGSVTKSFSFGRGPRLVAGIEGRGYLFSSAALPSLFRAGVPVANASVLLTLGVEFPWSDDKAGVK